MAEQSLDVHQLGTGVEQVGSVSMPQLVGADLLVDARLLQHQPQIRARRLPRDGFLTDRTGKNILALGPIFQPKPEHLAKRSRKRYQAFFVALADDPHRLRQTVQNAHVGGFKAQCFADPQPGVQQQPKQHLVASPGFGHLGFVIAEDVDRDVMPILQRRLELALFLLLQPDRDSQGTLRLVSQVDRIAFRDLVAQRPAVEAR